MKLKELKKTVVHCKTREEFDRLMQIYQEAGWVWSNDHNPVGEKYHGEHVWNIEREETCVLCIDKFGFDCCKHFLSTGFQILTLSEFLREQGIDADKQPSGPIKYMVYKQEGVDIQLWVRDGTAQIHKRGRNGKTFTIVGDADQWVEIFFQGYASAQ
jgi:hypothetical protein